MCINEANQRNPLDTQDTGIVAAACSCVRSFLRLLTGEAMVEDSRKQVTDLLNESRRMPR